jgi:hypothetical protein
MSQVLSHDHFISEMDSTAENTSKGQQATPRPSATTVSAPIADRRCSNCSNCSKDALLLRRLPKVPLANPQGDLRQALKCNFQSDFYQHSHFKI